MSEPVPVVAVQDIADEIMAEIRDFAASHTGLKTVLDWCLAQHPPIHDTSVVTQDEFTHDLIVPLPSGLYLVYDST